MAVNHEGWYVKVRIGDTGSVVDIQPTEVAAQRVADYWNLQYQSDTYYVEEFDEAKRAAWPRAGKRNREGKGRNA